MKDKRQIRKEVLDIRKRLLKDEVVKNSILITNKLTAFDKLINSSCIMAYMDFKNEVITEFLIDHCLNLGKTVALPVIDSIDGVKKIFAYEIKDRNNELKPGAYGILEPVRQLSRRIDPKEIDMVIVPGVAFDINGNRIGYGAGCYDVFLREVKERCKKVGVAFEFQVFSCIPKDEHDISMDAIFTENRVIEK